MGVHQQTFRCLKMYLNRFNGLKCVAVDNLMLCHEKPGAYAFFLLDFILLLAGQGIRLRSRTNPRYETRDTGARERRQRFECSVRNYK